MTFGKATRHLAYANDLPGSRVDPDDDIWPCAYELLDEQELLRELHAVGRAETASMHAGQVKADTINFQPCVRTRSQDRAVVRELDVGGRRWIMMGVFDGHLGEETVEHVALHMPIIVQELLESMPCAVNGPKLDVEAISKGLKRRITEFDEAITKDVLDLWPGGLDGLSKLTNEHISSVINDGGKNLKKTKLCMYGTTALVALIDPTRENLWVANVGDCQGVLITTKPSGEATAEVLTRLHNGMNKSEILRVLREHPGEPGCVSNERVLGVIAPFRCLGDVPFKLPPIFTRKVLYNLHPGFHHSSPWEHFLVQNLTPPYISAHAEVVHQKLSPDRDNKQFLVLCTDGLTDVSGGGDPLQAAEDWAIFLGREARTTKVAESGRVVDNLAVELLYQVLGGEDAKRVSRALTLEMDQPWLDDITIAVASL